MDKGLGLVGMDSSLDGLTASLVRHVRRRIGVTMPDDVALTTRLCLLDWLGVTLAGSREPLSLMLLDEARDQGATPVASIFGHHVRTSSALAATVNAASADALDFSDGNLAMRGHTTPAVIATALALAQARGSTFGQLLDAIVAGIEMECRVGLLVNPPRLRKGFHPTGSLATFGATATAAALLGLTEAQWTMALGLASTQAAGLLASGGTMAKPFHSGKAAYNGLLAASLAQRGFISNGTALEAADGFLETHAHTPESYPAEVLNVDERYLVMGTIFKTHAACQLTHSTIENMRRLKSESGLLAGEVRSIELQVPRNYLSVCNIAWPKTALQAKFSLRGVAAMSLLGDDTRDIDAYRPERIGRPEMTALIERISVTARDDLGGGTSTALCTTTTGRRFNVTSDTYRPISDMLSKREVVTAKFMSLTTPLLGASNARALAGLIMTMDLASDIMPIFTLARTESLA